VNAPVGSSRETESKCPEVRGALGATGVGRRRSRHRRTRAQRDCGSRDRSGWCPTKRCVHTSGREGVSRVHRGAAHLRARRGGRAGEGTGVKVDMERKIPWERGTSLVMASPGRHQRGGRGGLAIRERQGFKVKSGLTGTLRQAFYSREKHKIRGDRTDQWSESTAGEGNKQLRPQTIWSKREHGETK